MMSVINTESVQNEIMKDIETKYGWIVHAVESNYLGYGNLKWIMTTNIGPIFVKQYCKIRYRRGLDGVRDALKYQHLMHLDGIPCQPVYSYNSEYIHTTFSGEDYMISGVSTGHLIKAGQLNSLQMYSLGEATVRMHMWMKTHMPKLPYLQWELPSKAKMFEKIQANLNEMKKMTNQRYIEAIENQRIILKELDLDIFNECAKGWAHWDMHVDNLLFHEDRLEDILDFDRLHYVYSDFDISRAILSSALLDDGKLIVESTRAYIDGYRIHTNLTIEQLVLSIKLTWYKEFKWVHEKYSQDKAMSRFIEELIWIGNEWENLEEIFTTIFN
ncbi:phosphotransferase [Paenibacillus xylanexedens]|uniref:phosphotransferase n=1 Tax=Paenibacillus xylanexedens TaxID=528191 RepID=UPI003B020741